MHSEGAIVCHVVASHSPLAVRSGIKTCNVQYCHLLSSGEREMELMIKPRDKPNRGFDTKCHVKEVF